MIFSKRKELALKVDEYISKNKIITDTFGVICVLESFGNLKDDAGAGVSSECNTRLCESASSQQTVQNAVDGLCSEVVKTDIKFLIEHHKDILMQLKEENKYPERCDEVSHDIYFLESILG